MQNLSEGAYKLRSLKLSAVAIASVVLVEVSLGLTVNSLAILSDGLHATLDVITSVMLFVATKAALKPPDEQHMYGHEKFEPIGGLTGGLILIGIGILLIYEAASKLMQGGGVNTDLRFIGFIAVCYTFFIDIFRLAIFRKTANSESTTVKAGLYHTIADFSSTVIAFFGFGLSTWGFSQGDSISSIVLGLLLSYLSVRLVRSSIMELSDSASKELVQKTRREILSHEGVLKCENLKVRKVSSKIFVEATLQVSSFLSLEEAHTLASKIESNLKRTFGNVDATIHIEPSEGKTKMKQVVEKLATVEGIKEVHEVATVYASGKLYITLHAYVDPSLSVGEAHEIAEKIEKRMQSGITQLENVTVHMEPYGSEVRAAEIDENEIRKIIQKVAGGAEQDLYVKRIVAYIAERKRFINMDCCFTKHISITEAHKIASQIEQEIKERVADAVVTVHMEPHCQ